VQELHTGGFGNEGLVCVQIDWRVSVSQLIGVLVRGVIRAQVLNEAKVGFDQILTQVSKRRSNNKKKITTSRSRLWTTDRGETRVDDLECVLCGGRATPHYESAVLLQLVQELGRRSVTPLHREVVD
jgi:hypothetical protein